jgi:hypothetical protein
VVNPIVTRTLHELFEQGDAQGHVSRWVGVCGSFMVGAAAGMASAPFRKLVHVYGCVRVCMCVFACVYMYVYVYVNAYMYVYNVYLRVCICMCTYT